MNIIRSEVFQFIIDSPMIFFDPITFLLNECSIIIPASNFVSLPIYEQILTSMFSFLILHLIQVQENKEGRNHR